MTISDGQQGLAHVSVAAPPDLVAAGSRRLDIYLRQDAKGRFRWHYADGKPTVVEGANVEQALEVARLVWRDVRVVSRAESVAPPS